MGLFTRDIKTFDDLFMHTLQDIYYAENQIAKSLPTMIEKATSPELKQAFQAHLVETRGQIQRLQQVFQALGKEASGVECKAIDGIIAEAEEISGEVADREVMDAALLASAQAVEHYEITRYGTLIAWAQEMGRAQIVPHLEQNLMEEKSTDKKLSALAESRVNRRAM